MLLTIAIPTYNNESTISKSIESCISQSNLEDTEILIINNASTDDTQSIINKYKNNKVVRAIELKTNISMYSNHNLCLKESLGRYVLFCHSDDQLDVDAVKIIKENLIKRQFPKKYIFWGYGMTGDYSYCLEQYGLKVGQMFAGQRAVLPHLSGGLPPSGTCYSKDILEYGGFLDTNHYLQSSDSSSMVYLAIKGYRFEMIENIIGYKFLGSTHKPNQKLETLIASYADAYDLLKAKLSEDEKDRLLNSAIVYNHRPPVPYLNYESNFNAKKIFKPLIVHSLLRPWLWGKPLFLKAFFNVILKIIIGKKTNKIKN